MQTITPSLWFDGVAAEAADFYVSLFPDSAVTSTSHYPTEGLADFQAHIAGKELTVNFTLAGLDIVAINAGPEFAFTPAASFMVTFDPSVHSDASQRLDRLWDGLTDGGSVMMPLDRYPFSPRFGWVSDRYGLSWQLILSDPGGAAPGADPRPMVMPALMFCGPAQDRAAEAIEYYTALFAGSGVGTIAQRDSEPESGSAPAAGSVMFADFHLADQWFAAMDSGAEQPFTFNEAMSFMVAADGQEEIDRYWDALSAVPESEQCGWCKDRFGLSWQVVPANLEELMGRPDGYQKMIRMKKFVISEF